MKRKMGTKLTTREFIDKARSIHGDFYDYSLVEYIGSKSKVTITCPIHGEFEQLPNSHLRGYGCKQCGSNSRVKIRTSNTEEFIQKAKKIHGNKYDYTKTNYANSKVKVTIVCSIHGDFYQIPNTHLSGRGCPNCKGDNLSQRQIYTTDKFIDKAKNIHGDNYDYSKVEYIDSITKVTITCPVHGEFQQIPSSHLIGHGCPECADENKGFWNPEYIKKYKDTNKPCNLYVIECYSDDERFIKVGITTRTLEERYYHYSVINGYQYTTLYEYQSTLLECSETEQELLNKFKEHQYIPECKFEGSTECIDIVCKDSLLETISP